MSFKTWFLLQRHRKDPIGDLAREAASDPALNHGPWSVGTIRRQLGGYPAPEAARYALDHAWHEWHEYGVAKTVEDYT
jgi:hypothetical protein